MRSRLSRISRLSSHASPLTPLLSRLSSHASPLTPLLSRLSSHASLRFAEFQWISRHSDALIKAETPELGKFLVAGEVQLRYTNKMPRRMRAYTALSEEKYELPVYPILINVLPPSESTTIVDHYESDFLGKRALQEYDVINLWEVDAELAFEQKPLLPFVPIMKGGDDKKVIQQALNELRADEKLKELEMRLAFFASFVLESKIIQQIMRWDMIVLRESPWYQEIIQQEREIGREEGREEGIEQGREIGREEGIEQGREIGREEGIEQGREIGRLEEARQAAFRHVLQILDHNFDEVSQELEEALQTLESSSLETLLGVALSAATLEEFQQHPLLV